MGDQLREKRVELILQQLEELPTLPAVAVRVLEVTGKDDSSAKEVIALISSDQSLTTRVLQLLHRADAGVRGDIDTVDRAVVMLGFDAVRSVVLAVSVFHALGQNAAERKGVHFSRDEFWKHSVAVACCAELLAERLPGPDALEPEISRSEAFVCGLLHDLGKVALDAALPKSFDRVVEATDLLRGNIADLERSIIGLDHMVVGKRLAERWGLPTTIRECIWLHGQAPEALPQTVKSPKLVNLITLADVLVREQHLGYSGNYAFTLSRQSLLGAVGLGQSAVDEVTSRLVSHIEPRATSLGLGQTNSDDLYLQALTQANKELGRMSSQLAAKNKRLAVRAKFFDALSHFQSELRADAAPQLVLQAIGQTAVSVLDVTSAAVFSAIPGQGFAEVLLFDDQGDVFQHSVLDCPKPLANVRGGDGPVLAAGAELEWLLANVSPRLAADRRYWISLEADGQCIGGVAWGGNGKESVRLAGQVQEVTALAIGWGLALRTAQIREESRALAEQLAEANRRLQSAQDEIQRSKTIITVGEMAAGAAHEMNNPLAVISGRSQLLASQLTDPRQKHAATQIYEQSHRLSEIITELMDFAKPEPPKREELELAELVERALHEAKLLTDPADRSIEVTIADVPPVIVDPKQVTAALIEVVSNAIQATDEQRGHITIHAAYEAHGARVVMSVNDNGCGMDEETLKRAFDPFFSSKPAGRRRGMGLAKALRWLEASGGSIRLESRVDKGTRSIILLPAAPVTAGRPEWKKAAEG
jgi:signal transduction histidine kinase/HD-like signal output (HDOD) protein